MNEVKTNIDGVFWYKNGTLHRDDGPAIELKNGSKEYWVEGNRHRENGPAVEHVAVHTALATVIGKQEWWVNGNLHREDGPAVVFDDGRKEWWVNGTNLRIEEAVPDPNVSNKELWFESEDWLKKATSIFESTYGSPRSIPEQIDGAVKKMVSLRQLTPPSDAPKPKK